MAVTQYMLFSIDMCMADLQHAHLLIASFWALARAAELLAGLQPRDFSFLVVNCSLFNPTPSLSALVINHFKMRSDIVSYNLGGV